MNLMAHPDRVAMLSGNESARQMKAVIGISDFLIASRYHSLVAAFSMRTPVAVIGWSHKYDELMQLVGLADFIVDPVRKYENDDQLIEIVTKAYKQRDIIAAKLVEKVPKIERDVRTVFGKLKVLISSGTLNSGGTT
jgi:polysaccharide pyruvyl transferase WcaK-like protein